MTTTTNTTTTTSPAANPLLGLFVQALRDTRDPLFKASEENRIRARSIQSFSKVQDGIESARQSQTQLTRGAYVAASSIKSSGSIPGTMKAGMFSMRA